jgi:hypothetical protein
MIGLKSAMVQRIGGNDGTEISYGTKKPAEK